MSDLERQRLAARLARDPEDPETWIRYAELASRRVGLRDVRSEDAPGEASAASHPDPPGLPPPAAACAALRRRPEARGLATWILALRGLSATPDATWGGDGLPTEVVCTGAAESEEGTSFRRVPPFEALYLGTRPVSVAGFAAFLRASGARPPPAWRELRRLVDRPMVCVAHGEAAAYAAWRGGYLPEARHYEVAAYGGDRRRYPWGDEAPAAARAAFGRPAPASLGGYPNPRGYPGDPPPPLGTRPAGRGPFGHEDLVGLVWEWCRDGGEPRGPAEAADLEEDEGGARTDAPVFGGGFRSPVADLARGELPRVDRDRRDDDLGFRVLLDLAWQDG